jgi:hypothetical protein
MTTRTSLTSARKALEKPVDFATWAAALGSRDRVNVERHLAAVEALPGGIEHAKNWRRLAQTLATLSPFAATTTGQQAVSFFQADGKYRMQVFALEDNRDGKISAYCVDVLEPALEAKILEKPSPETPAMHPIVDGGGKTLLVEQLSAANTPNPSSYYKHMLGWNRKALRVTVQADTGETELKAMELVLALAAGIAGKTVGTKAPTNVPGGAGAVAPQAVSTATRQSPPERATERSTERSSERATERSTERASRATVPAKAKSRGR